MSTIVTPVLHMRSWRCRFIGDIFKFEISFIEEEFVVAHIAGEEDIGQTVVINIADGYAAAIVEIAKQKAVVQSAVFHVVLEVNAGAVHQGEQRLFLRPVTAGKEGRQGEEAGNNQRSGR